MVGEAGAGVAEADESAFGFETKKFFIFFLQPFGSEDLWRGTII